MVILQEVKLLILLNIGLYINGHTKENNMFYILQWTDPLTNPFQAMGVNQEAFIYRDCLYKNCFVTHDTDYLDSITDFDVVAFNAVDLHRNSSLPLPTERSESQKYVVVSRESAVYYPVPSHYDNYFNWTWSYRLDSDVYFGYIAIRNNNGTIIGPKEEMDWMHIEDMKPTTKYIKRKLRNKHIAAAWFVSNCAAKNKRLEIAENLKKELEIYGQKLDIYGRCGDLTCPEDGLDEGCLALIESDYYFYLAFENSFDEDYVTEKLLMALEHFAVPVVYGGANYSRFLPEGIYLDASIFKPDELAREINDAINDKKKYYEYFKWHNHYSYHDSYARPDTDGVCAFCAFLNDDKKRNEMSVRENFSLWWNFSTINATEDPVTVKTTITENIDIPSDVVGKTEDGNSIKEFLNNLFSLSFVSNWYSYLSE